MVSKIHELKLVNSGKKDRETMNRAASGSRSDAAWHQWRDQHPGAKAGPTSGLPGVFRKYELEKIVASNRGKKYPTRQCRICAKKHTEIICCKFCPIPLHKVLALRYHSVKLKSLHAFFMQFSSKASFATSKCKWSCPCLKELNVCKEFRNWGEGKVVPVLNQLSTTPWRRVGEWMYRSTFSWLQH
jgi:hypothetical protein